jgi:hypothetical protein
MKRLQTFIVLAIMTTGLLVNPAASADDNTCWLEAANSDIYLTVWDLDAEGNELAKIWQGLLKQTDKQKLVTTNGKIRYFTNISAESTSAGVDKICRNAETISLP